MECHFLFKIYLCIFILHLNSLTLLESSCGSILRDLNKNDLNKLILFAITPSLSYLSSPTYISEHLLMAKHWLQSWRIFEIFLEQRAIPIVQSIQPWISCNLKIFYLLLIAVLSLSLQSLYSFCFQVAWCCIGKVSVQCFS